MEYPIFSFSYIFVVAILKMPQEKECIPKFSWQNFNTINNPSNTILVSNERSKWVLSTSVNFNDEIYH